jgi:2-keto-4-pentenoate hydratase/2-oxohepta-3-ene-1,7-dioic acid hydratase in catechol pathway
MKIARFRYQDRSAYGVVLQDAFVAEPSADFVARYPDIAAVFTADANAALAQDVAGRTSGLPLGEVQLLPPLSAHNKIICVGINYRKKYPVQGVAPPDPDHIILFAKHHDAVVGQGQALELPQGDAAQTFDYEGEITLVIGKAGRHIAREAAMSHVAGYTILNDGSVRGWQKHSLHAGKNFANSGGCGPWIVTTDTIDKVSAMTVSTYVNGELRQDGPTENMIFDIPTLIETISRGITLYPGDIIATGTPAGVGMGLKPPQYLKAGDVVRVEIDGIGHIENKFV